MKISVRWLNEYLEPANVTAAGAEEVLTNAGFPIEEAVELPSGDVMLDVEVTSNRGDCLSHIGVAREIAAATGRRLRMPTVPDKAPANGENLNQIVRLDNRVPDVCRLFTLRVVRGVKVGPSPQWMVDALAGVGQRSINNVVDVTNFVMFELGQPSHAFDLAKLAQDPKGVASVIVRYAAAGEKLMLLDGKTITLKSDELVVADTNGASSLAGIMGGRGSEVTDSSTDILLEAATWDPLTVRRAARRLQLGTDASFRFERTVDPRTIDFAARRAADLLVQLGGPNARLVAGSVEAGAEPRPLTRVSLRPSRTRAILGAEVPTPEIEKCLTAHGIEVTSAPPLSSSIVSETPLECVIPAHRPDIDREIDLIEEVARTRGLAGIPILEKLPVRVSAPQLSERAMRELTGALSGLGFFETITFSFQSSKQANPFLPKDLQAVQLCDERRKADPILRPSVIPSLLACRRANQDAGVVADGGVRLFEIASVYAQTAAAAKDAKGKELETRVLALLADAQGQSASAKGFDVRQESIRLMRGVIESIARALGGAEVRIELTRAELPFAGLDAVGSAKVSLVPPSGQPIHLGTCGMVSAAVLQSYDLATPCVVAELNVAALLSLYPPRSRATPLPEFPGIERDLSFVVAEKVEWGSVEKLIAESRLDRLEAWEFITTYRGAYRDGQNNERNLGKQGQKAVTVRLRFRDPARTLRHEEVDPQVAALVQLATSRLGAELRM